MQIYVHRYNYYMLLDLALVIGIPYYYSIIS